MKEVQSRLGKFKMALLAAAAVFSVPMAVMAATTSVTGTAKFLGAITLTPTGMNFGNITWTSGLTTGDTAVLKTDGTFSVTGTRFADGGGGSRVAGNLNVTGDSGSTVNIYCTASTTLGKAGPVTIALNAIKISTLATAGAGGSACNGTGGAAAISGFTLTAGPDVFKLGATIDAATITGTFASGTYTTALGAGDIQVVVIYT